MSSLFFFFILHFKCCNCFVVWCFQLYRSNCIGNDYSSSRRWSHGSWVCAFHNINLQMVVKTMSEGLMFISKMKKTEPDVVRRCRNHLRNILGGIYVRKTHLFPVHQYERISHRIDYPWRQHLRLYNEYVVHCDLCRCDIQQDYLVNFLTHTRD